MAATFILQPTLSNALITAIPLQAAHFEALYAVASDPLIWAQHPNPLRYQLPAFTAYFEGAILSQGALLIHDAASGSIIGSTRYSRLVPGVSVDVGYTFYSRAYWGQGHNHSLKRMMITHAFEYVQLVQFYIGALNLRSQISIERLGATKTDEVLMAYHGEPDMLNFKYVIHKADWAG